MNIAEIDLIDAYFPSATFIYLRRTDKSRQAISWYRAIRRDVWWQFAEFGVSDDRDAAGCEEPPNFAEIARLEALLIHRESLWVSFLYSSGITPYEVVYETLSDHYVATVSAIYDQLNLWSPNLIEILTPRLMKQADGITDRWLRQYGDWKNATSKHLV